MGSHQLDVAEFTETVEAEFHNVTYSISVSTLSSDTLCIEVEQHSDASRWRGEFTSRYIEDITAKTGNYKKFPVFVRMLLSALKRQSDSVFVDLLTYQDLELLKNRKGKGQAQLTRSIPPNNKRYFILTYAAEFDRVHYPLPLLFEENPDPAHLRNIIKQLRADLDAARATAARKPAEAAAEVRRLREENATLRGELQNAQQQLLNDGNMELHELMAELRVVQRERDLLQARVESAAADLERERGVHRRELRRKGKEVDEAQLEVQRQKEQIRELRLKCKELTQELEASNRKFSSDRLRRAYGGGRDIPRDSRPPPSLTAGRGSSRGPSPSTSRAPSPSASASSGRESLRQRPGSAPARGRFDPTEYVRQKRERERQMLDQKRAPTPRSGMSSGRSTPNSSRPNSATRGGGGFSRHSSGELQPSTSEAGKLVRGGSGQPSPRPPWGSVQKYNKFPTGACSQAAAGLCSLQDLQRRPLGAGKPAERAASPGRALQDVKQKLTEYAQKQTSIAAGTTTSLQLPAANGHPEVGKVYDDPSSEIADIDSRLHALQNFLKMAKTASAET